MRVLSSVVCLPIKPNTDRSEASQILANHSMAYGAFFVGTY